MAVLAESLNAPAARRRIHVSISLSQLLSLAGFAILAASWLGASRITKVEDQIPWLALAMIGSALACGVPVWSLTGQRREIAVRLARMTALLEFDTTGPQPTSETDPGAGGELVASPAMVRYHRPDCPLAVGKAVAAASRPDHAAAGRRPCGVCEP